MNQPMPANKVQVPRISDAVAASLEKRILEGSLKPGDRLPPERELATELGVSRPSLREAIQKLASKGMLQSRQGGGTYVTDRLESSFSDPWQAMMGSHPNLREDLLEFRRMLEGQAAEWAAERATEADLQRLEQAFSAMTDAFASDDLERRSTTDIAFHQAVGEAAHNALIGHLSAALLRLMHDNIRLNLGELKTIPSATSLLAGQTDSPRSPQDYFAWEIFGNRGLQQGHATLGRLQMAENLHQKGLWRPSIERKQLCFL